GGRRRERRSGQGCQGDGEAEVPAQSGHDDSSRGRQGHVQGGTPVGDWGGFGRATRGGRSVTRRGRGRPERRGGMITGCDVGSSEDVPYPAPSPGVRGKAP